MELKEFLEIAGFVILVGGFIFNLVKQNEIKTNCIATLTTKVDDLEKKMTTMWTKFDKLVDDINGMHIHLATMEQKIKDKLGNGGYLK